MSTAVSVDWETSCSRSIVLRSALETCCSTGAIAIAVADASCSTSVIERMDMVSSISEQGVMSDAVEGEEGHWVREGVSEIEAVMVIDRKL